MMKIVHAIETINPATGGPAVVAVALATAQATMGNDVTVACYGEPQFDEWLESLCREAPELRKVRFAAIPYDGLKEKLLAGNARRAFRRLAADADVIHVHGIWSPFAASASRAGLQKGRKLVITPHGMLDPWSLRQRRLKKRIALLLIWKRILSAAHFIHALNKTEAQLIEPLDIRAAVKVFPNGVFTKDFMRARDGSLFRRRFELAADKRYVLFLGRLHYKKGLDYLIEAFALVCNSDRTTDLVISGPDEGMRRSVDEWVRGRGLESRVHVTGPIYGEIKMSALAGCGCFCLPSRQEGFSMAILEALACGIPVVISEECHFPEVAAAGAGAVVTLEPPVIAKALLQLLSDEALHARASHAARALVEGQYDWSVIAHDMIIGYR
jgi:glycosyltransferase involved in cell wall biosynthesis